MLDKKSDLRRTLRLLGACGSGMRWANESASIDGIYDRLKRADAAQLFHVSYMLSRAAEFGIGTERQTRRALKIVNKLDDLTETLEYNGQNMTPGQRQRLLERARRLAIRTKPLAKALIRRAVANGV